MYKMFIIKFIVLLLILPQIIFSQEKTFEDQLEKLSDKIKNNPGQYNDYVPYWKIKFRLNEDIESLRNCLEEFESNRCTSTRSRLSAVQA